MTDELVPDKIVREEMGGITPMTLWRWTHDPDLKFPQPVVIRRRKFRSRKLLEKFKQRMMRVPIKDIKRSAR